jgi:hypothetical protein
MKHQEEVTRAWVAVVMAEAHATQAERMARERVVLLATIGGEADKVAQRVSILEGELMAARRARDVAEEKISHLVAMVVTAEWQRIAMEE